MEKAARANESNVRSQGVKWCGSSKVVYLWDLTGVLEYMEASPKREATCRHIVMLWWQYMWSYRTWKMKYSMFGNQPSNSIVKSKKAIGIAQQENKIDVVLTGGTEGYDIYSAPM